VARVGKWRQRFVSVGLHRLRILGGLDASRITITAFAPLTCPASPAQTEKAAFAGTP
jgi:hypothetical protein